MYASLDEIKTTAEPSYSKVSTLLRESNYVNEHGLYRSTDNDGYTYYYRGAEGCTYTGGLLKNYTTYETCIENNGLWSYNDSDWKYNCYANGTKDACETSGGTWYSLDNTISFAGFVWKIIRINGDGSIRIILDNTTPEKSMQQELIEDLIAIMTSFSGKMHGLRSKKNKILKEKMAEVIDSAIVVSNEDK